MRIATFCFLAIVFGSVVGVVMKRKRLLNPGASFLGFLTFLLGAFNSVYFVEQTVPGSKGTGCA